MLISAGRKETVRIKRRFTSVTEAQVSQHIFYISCQ